MSEKMNSIESTPPDPSILIEHDIIARSALSENPEAWIAKHGKKFRELWDTYKEFFLEKYEENPEELYGIISQRLESAEYEAEKG